MRAGHERGEHGRGVGEGHGVAAAKRRHLVAAHGEPLANSLAMGLRRHDQDRLTGLEALHKKGGNRLAEKIVGLVELDHVTTWHVVAQKIPTVPRSEGLVAPNHGTALCMPFSVTLANRLQPQPEVFPMNTCVLRMNTAPGQRCGAVQAPACGNKTLLNKIKEHGIVQE